MLQTPLTGFPGNFLSSCTSMNYLIDGMRSKIYDHRWGITDSMPHSRSAVGRDRHHFDTSRVVFIRWTSSNKRFDVNFLLQLQTKGQDDEGGD